MTPMLVALAGSLGAVSRFVLDGHIKTTYSHIFPWATFAINMTGSFVLGTVTGLHMAHHGFASMSTVIGVGFCGGYTTFSTASFETVRLLERRDYKRAIGNAAGSLVAAVALAAVGLAVGRAL